jgi:hypothetical protein
LFVFNLFFILTIVGYEIYKDHLVNVKNDLGNQKSVQNIKTENNTSDIEAYKGLGNGDPREMAEEMMQLVLLTMSLNIILLFCYAIYIRKYDKRKSNSLVLTSIAILILLLMAFGISQFKIEKPVIYLYPPNAQDVSVQLNYKGKLIADYPDYDYSINGWKVKAYPDGHLINYADNQEYSYIFWEGIPKNKIDINFSQGFVVKGSEIKKFLQTELKEIGLTPKEYNEFITYWYPRMKDNDYNLINFKINDTEYNSIAQLNITPKPDSILRVYMVYKPIRYMRNVAPQEFKGFDRSGFTVVEWGGTEIR